MSKTLNASVKLNTTDAENKLKRLAVSISYINKAINGKSTNALEASLDKQLVAAQKVRKATADAELAELRLASAKEKQAQVAQKQRDAELQAINRQAELERNLALKKQQAEQVAFERKQQQEERQAIQQKKREEAEAQRELRRQEQAAERARKAAEKEAKLIEKRRIAEETAARKVAEQERKLREKQHKEEQRRIEKEKKLRMQANREISHDILSKLKGVLGAYLGVMGLQAAINTSDTITSAENKLNNINGGNTNATQEQMDAMYAAAQRSRMKYGDMMGNVSKSMTLAPDAFKGDINNAIKFQEIMGKSYALGGASAAEQSSSMYQLIQALGSGKLQGDELRSMTEGAPLAAKAIEKYAQELYGTTDALKDMGSAGLITSDIVVAAMMKQGDAVEKAFADTKMTFAQAGVMIQNTATKAFEPALQKINEALNILAETGFFDALAVVLTLIGKVAYWVASGVAWMAENWNWLKVIILPLVTLIGLVTMALIAFSVAQAVVHFWNNVIKTSGVLAWLSMLWPIMLIIVAIVAVIAILNACGVSFSELAGYVVGAVLWLASVIWNTVIGVVNAILQFLWTMFIERWIGIIEWVLNVFNGGFNSFGDAVKNLLGNIISWFLSLGKVVTTIIDAIFGTDWTGGLNQLQDKVLDWGKNETAITLNREAPTIQSLTDGKVDRWASKDAYNTGFDWASNGVNSIGDKLTNWDEKLGIDKEFGDAEKATAENTGKMADSMQLAEEDLKYLRDVANMEWKKEFTTANITVDMTNNNTVSNDYDLNSLAIGLRNLVEEEMHVVANGVYA